MYTIIIYDRTFNEVTKLFMPNIYDLSYSTELSKAGGASFKIRVLDPKATAANLKLFNRVIIYKGGVGKFIGYIDELQATINEIEVTCTGMLGLFERRLYTDTINNTQAGTAVFDILTDTNSYDDTGIVAGDTDVVQIVNNVQFSRSTVLAAWQKIANMVNAEFRININQALEFKTQIGDDKSGSIILQYNVGQINIANLFNFDVAVKGKDIANRVTGIRQGGTVIKDDVTSIQTFGLLEHSENFSQTSNNTDLENETQNYVDDHKSEFYTPNIQVNTEKIDSELLEIGDTVRVFLSNGFIVVNQNHRIIKKSVTVSNNNTEQVDLGLIPEGTNLLPSTFVDDIITMQKRLNLLEGTIT